MSAVVLAAESGFHVPSVQELFEWPAFSWSENWSLGGVDLAFNRVTMLYALAAVLAAGLMVVAFRQPKVVPSKFQGAMEGIVDFVRTNIVVEVIGPAGLRFVPFLTSLFLFIWMCNLMSILPFIQFSPTSRMAVPAFLAFTVWTIFILVGMKEQGPLRYLKNVVIPPGVPKAALILLIPIELVSTFIFRPLTLAIRLFANMMAGHILLAIMFVVANTYLFNFETFDFNLGLSLGIGVVGLAAGPVFVAFELLVGVLQAYIFTILAAVYIGGALHPEH